MSKRLYSLCGAAAATCLAAITALICIQVLGRLLDRSLQLVGVAPLNAAIPSIAEICGYLLAAATFLALADTFARGGHIRVTLFLTALPARYQRSMEFLAGVIALAVVGGATLGIGKLAWKSWSFGDVSSGMVAVPLALPQAVMAFGLLMLCISVVDRLLYVVRNGAAPIDSAMTE